MFLVQLTALAQFDWGSGCGGGAGAPFSITLPEGDTATVGTIPEGTWAVEILLSSAADVDVQLFDDASGEPVIGWCETKPSNRAKQIEKGCGLLVVVPFRVVVICNE